jgi:hypothetical protein
MPVIHSLPTEFWRQLRRASFCFVASGPFDGLAHEPRRHGVQLACRVLCRVPWMLRRSRRLQSPSHGSIGTTVELTNVDLWLQFAEVPSDLGEVVHQSQGVGVVLSQHPLVARQGPLKQLAGAVQVA